MTAEKRSAGDDGSTDSKRTKEDYKLSFSDGLFGDERREGLKKFIEESGPYKHGVINELISDDLLRKVRDEILSSIQFTKKETDIYKVYQTGDLANLSGLDADELKQLQSLNQLRNALYSQEFRDYLSYVAGSGPLSGSKKDLSINVYHKGCHLLNHDDVIGSRRISYILYLPDPDEPWQPKWGGALRLYPTLKPNIPETDWTLAIPPKWNQLAFFTVQPGLSFHDVEEVFVEKPRMSISGWFHIPQRGEEGFKEGEQEDVEALSSLKQLESGDLRDMDFPKRKYEAVQKSDGSDFGPEDVEYLKEFLNPGILEEDAMKKLNEMFCEDSALEIRDFLNEKYAALVRKAIDVDDLAIKIPQTSKEVPKPWDIARPPHKYRYLYLDNDDLVEPTQDVAAHVELQKLRNVFQHPSYIKWLAKVSSLTPTGAWILARRFRPGFDFTLATTHESDKPVLEATLSLTPSKGWEHGEFGGYDLCMSVDENDDSDPAVYKGAAQVNGTNNDPEDDPVLLNNQASWNVFSLIVRDQGILRFVKYVSKNAPGSRWDVSAEWTIEDDDEE